MWRTIRRRRNRRSQRKVESRSRVFGVEKLEERVLLALDSTTYAYDVAGNVASITDGNGQQIDYGFDGLGRLTSVTGATGGFANFEYDGNSNLTKMQDATGFTFYAYDDFDRVTSIARSADDVVGNVDDITVGYQYDNAGNVTQIVYPDGTDVAYTYDELNRLAAVQQGTDLTTYTYFADGSLETATLPNGITSTYSYDTAGRLTDIVHENAQSELVSGFHYELDANGNRTRMEVSRPDPEDPNQINVGVYAYDYDSREQLVEAAYPDGSVVAYTYDGAGNRLTMSTDPEGAGPADPEVLTYHYSVENRLDYISDASGAVVEAFAYDANGNTVMRVRDTETIQYEWDYRNLLVAVDDGATRVEYEYDGLGDRVGRIVDGVRTEYVNDVNQEFTQVLQELDGAGSVESRYIYGLGRISGILPEQTNQLFYQSDALGSHVDLTNETGLVVESHNFDAFGEAKSAAPSGGLQQTANAFRFAGESFEPIAGLIYFRARYYDPHLGRFISKDPLLFPDGPNTYQYALNNPVTRIDPSGLDSINELWDDVQEVSVDVGVGGPVPGFTFRESVEFFPATGETREVTRIGQDAPVLPTPAGLVQVGYRFDPYSDSVSLRGSLVRPEGTYSLSAGSRLRLGYSTHGPGPRIGVSVPYRLALNLAQGSSYFSRLGADVGARLGQSLARGGVLLDQAATFAGDLASITGATVDPVTGEVILLGEQDASVEGIRLDDLVAALRAVYSSVYDAPGVTIDPIAEDPDNQLVRVFAGLEDTHLGYVFFEADRVMKSLTAGKDNITGLPVSSSVNGYKSLLDRWFETELQNPGGAETSGSRFWFVIDNPVLRRSSDQSSFLFDSVSVKLLTEEEFVAGVDIDPDAAAFAQWFNDNFQAIADEAYAHPSLPGLEHPFRRLDQAARAVALAIFLRDNNVPLDFGWIENSPIAHVDTPETTPTVENSRTQPGQFTIIVSGGVDFSSNNAYSADAGQVVENVAIDAQDSRPDEIDQTWTLSDNTTTALAVSLLPDERDGNVVVVDTDLSFPTVGDAPLNLTRFYNSFEPVAGPLGFSWELTPAALTFSRPAYQDAPLSGGGNLLGLREGTVRFVDRSTGELLTFESSLVVGDQFIEGYNNGNLLFYPQEFRDGSVLDQSADRMSYTLTRPGGATLSFDADGQLLQSADSNGNAIDYNYDNDRLTSISSSAGQSIVLSYDAVGRIQQAVGPAGERVVYAYDANGDLTTATRDRGNRMFTYTYDANHRLTSATGPDGLSRMSTQFDILNRSEQLMDARGNQFDYMYTLDRAAEMRTTTIEDVQTGLQAMTEFDLENRPVTVTDLLGRMFGFQYAAGSMRPLPTSISLPDPNRADITFSYDSEGKLTAIMDPENDPDGNGFTERFTYSFSANNLTSHVDANEVMTSFAYDANNNLTGVTRSGASVAFGYLPNGLLGSITDQESHTTSFAYDTVGNLMLVTDQLGGQTQYEYDTLSRLTKIIDPENREVTFTYNDDDLVTAITAPQGQLMFEYHPTLKRLTSQTDFEGNETMFTYDSDTGDLLTVTDMTSSTMVNYAYDRFGNLELQEDQEGTRTMFAYDPLNRLMSRSTGHGYLDLQIVADAVSETDGSGATTAMLTRRNVADLSQALVVSLVSSNTQGAAPAMTQVTIPAESDSVQFSIDAMDDGVAAGDRQVLFLARAEGFGTGTDMIAVLDVAMPASTSVGLDAMNNLLIADVSGADTDNTFMLSVSGANIRVHDPTNVLMAETGTIQVDANTVDVPVSSIMGTMGIIVDTRDGNDMLTVDFGGGNFATAITYNGGAQSSPNGDMLKLQGGGTFADATFAFDNANDGSINITGNPSITYTGLEPISFSINAINVTLNYSTTAETISVTDASGGETTVTSTAGESVTFNNPTGTLSINAGDTGDDIINVTSLATNYPANIAINGQGGSDTLNVNGAIGSAAGKNVSLTSETINNNSDIAVAAGGSVSLTADRNIAMTPGSSISVVDGNVTLAANTAGTLTGDFVGIHLDNASITTTGDGTIALIGTGGNTADDHGVLLHSGSVVSSTKTTAGAGSITIIGVGQEGDSSDGVEIVDAGTTVTSKVGAIQITGTAAADDGVQIENGGTVSSTGSGAAAATITIEGTAGAVDANADGVIVFGGTITSVDGAIQIVGSTLPGGRDGIELDNGAVVSSTGTGASAATITLQGTAGTISGADGVKLEGAGTQLTSVAGAIQLTGIANASSDDGVEISGNSEVSSTGTGAAAATITLNGTGGNGNGGASGIVLATLGRVTSIDGDIDLVGTGGGVHGIRLSAGAAISSTGTGADAAGISISGTSGNAAGANGVELVDSGTQVTSAAGPVQISGDGSSGVRGVNLSATATVQTTSGPLTVTGTGGSGSGVRLSTSMGHLLSDTGDINLIGDTFELLSGSIQSNGALAIRPQTPATTIGLGDGSGTLNLIDAELGLLADGFSSITIGDTTNGVGDVDIDTVTFLDPVTIAGGAIKDNAGTDISAPAVTLDGNVSPGQSPGILSVLGDFVFAAGDTFTAEIGGTTAGNANNNHDQISVTGTVTIGSNVDLNAVAFSGFSPSTDDTFVIIDNDGAEAVVGTFAGLTEGATINGFLGSNRRARISYLGGDGNDIVLTVVDDVSIAQGWAAASGQGGANPDDGAASVAVDSAGNTYVAGSVFFIADPGTYLGNADITLAKYSPTGDLLWEHQIGDPSSDQRPTGIAIGAGGTVFLTGNFTGTVDFDPGIAEVSRTSSGAYDFFVAKYDTAGNFLDVATFGQSDVRWDRSTELALDDDENVLLTGYFAKTMDFDPGPGNFPLSALGERDIYLLKLTSDLQFIWAKQMGGAGTEFEVGASVNSDAAGNVYLAGRFEGTSDFDRENIHAGDVDILTSNGTADAFAAKYDPNGQFLWVHAMGGDGGSYELATDIEAAASGEVTVVGLFRGTNFSPGGGAETFDSVNNGFDIYITQYDSLGTFQWAKQIGSAGDDRALGVAADASGDPHIVGSFNAHVDFDPSPGGTTTLLGHSGGTSRGGDGFLLKLDSDGNFEWVRGFGIEGEDSIPAIAVGPADHLHVAGFFTGPTVVNTGTSTVTLTSAGGTDAFAAKLVQNFGSVMGVVWDDQNGNETQDGLEEGLADWTVYLDLNNSGDLNNGDIYTLTDTDGGYTFQGLSPGDYTVRQVRPAGWVQTHPAPHNDSQQVAVTPSVATTRIDFGNNNPPPTLAITRAGSSPTNADSVTFNLTFSESVTLVEETDFVLDRTGSVTSSDALVIGDAGDNDGSTYTLMVNNIAGEGTLGLDIAANTDIINGAGNLLDTTPTVDEVYTIGSVFAALDTNHDGTVDASTDGNQILTVLFGLPTANLERFRGNTTLTNEQIAAGIQQIAADGTLDVNEDGIVDASTDGNLIVSVLFGLPTSNLERFRGNTTLSNEEIEQNVRDLMTTPGGNPVAVSPNAAEHSSNPISAAANSSDAPLYSSALVQDPFPFTISGSQFLRDGEPVFLNIIGYSPLSPGQDVFGELDPARLEDDLRRLADYAADATEPLVLRLYPQPTAQFPQRFPTSFYDTLRDLDIWVIRDIYFDGKFLEADAIDDGKAAIDAVLAELESAQAFDRIFAFEWGNEFLAPIDTEARTPAAAAALKNFLEEMRNHLKSQMAMPGREDFSDWFTWGSLPTYDNLFSDTDGSIPVVFDMGDFYAYNVYPYFPEPLRDHQMGSTTGTPFQGYIEALMASFPDDKPLVISETGLASSAIAGQSQDRFHPWYPVYRYGGLNEDQVSEGIADRYFDAKLSDVVAGFTVFQWNDEWWKDLNPSSHSDLPEENFGIARFEQTASNDYELRYKLQQEQVQQLFSLEFAGQPVVVTGLNADDSTLATGQSTTVTANLATGAEGPVHFRWESNRGHVIGDSQSVQFYAGDEALGPATITVVGIDAAGHANRQSMVIDITSPGPPTIELITSGSSLASGRVSNVDLSQHKVVLYVETNLLYQQPFLPSPNNREMTSIWVNADGYFWTPNHNVFVNDEWGKLRAWVIPVDVDPQLTPPIGYVPPGAIAGDTLLTVNDSDNDLLPDDWEMVHFGNLSQDRYDDPDLDIALNIEELLSGGSPAVADNDLDTDGLADNWEVRYFGTTQLFSSADDPDNDGLDNAAEQNLGIHPGRTATDRDRDGLPDSWETRFFATLTVGPDDDTDNNGLTALDEYELGLAPANFATLDVNQDGVVDASTDGNLLLAVLFELPTSDLERFQGNTVRTVEEIEQGIQQLADDGTLDVNQDGVVDASTDGNLILTVLFDLPTSNLDRFRGNTGLTNAEIQQNIQALANPPAANSVAGGALRSAGLGGASPVTLNVQASTLEPGDVDRLYDAESDVDPFLDWLEEGVGSRETEAVLIDEAFLEY